MTHLTQTALVLVSALVGSWLTLCALVLVVGLVLYHVGRRELAAFRTLKILEKPEAQTKPPPVVAPLREELAMTADGLVRLLASLAEMLQGTGEFRAKHFRDESLLAEAAMIRWLASALPAMLARHDEMRQVLQPLASIGIAWEVEICDHACDAVDAAAVQAHQ